MVQLIEEQGREELSTAQRSAWMARLCSVDHAHNVPPYLGGSGFELLEFHKGSLIGLNKFKCNRSASAHLVRKENVIHQLPTERKPGFCYFRDMEFFTVDMLIAFGSLCFLEIVLGIDNIIFISLLTNQLEEERRPMARTAGIALALVPRGSGGWHHLLQGSSLHGKRRSLHSSLNRRSTAGSDRIRDPWRNWRKCL